MAAKEWIKRFATEYASQDPVVAKALEKGNRRRARKKRAKKRQDAFEADMATASDALRRKNTRSIGMPR